MYVVIFRAVINRLDNEYFETAKRLRDLAKIQYGCLEFVSNTEGDQEIALSYWSSKEQIVAWQRDPEHLQAQHRGQRDWYRSYNVEVVRIEREYAST